MIRKTLSLGKQIDGFVIGTESYWFLGALLYRRDVLVRA